MAFITIQTNQTINQEKQDQIKSELGQAVACVPYQSADSILVIFDDNKAMYDQGQNPVALVNFRAFGNQKHIGYGELTAQLSQILHRTLGIEMRRIFVEFADIYAFGVGEKYVQC